jgi:hypothetical protein
MKKYIYYLVFFLVFEVLVVSLLNMDKNNKIKIHNNAKQNKLKDEYKIVLNNYKVLTSILFNEVIDRPRVLEILKNMNSTDKVLQDQARKKLFAELNGFYDRLKDNDFRQFHFHLRNGDSFFEVS